MEESAIPLGNALIIWTTILLLSSSSFVAVRLWAKWQQSRPLADGVFVAGYVCMPQDSSALFAAYHDMTDCHFSTVHYYLHISTQSTSWCFNGEPRGHQLRELDGGGIASADSTL
jgi:hypothetical protein